MSEQVSMPPSGTGRKISDVFNQRTTQPMLPRPRRVTTMTGRVRPTQPSSSIRHSSPKSDRCHNATNLVLNDSVASAITSTSSFGNPVRRRSLSSGSLTSTSVSASNKTPVRSGHNDSLLLHQTALAQWAMVQQRLSELTTTQKQSEINGIKQLLTNCGEKLEELRAVRKAHAELTNYLRVTKALEAENTLLLSLISLLRPTAALDTANTPSNPGVLDRLKKLTVEELKPTYELLPLRGFTLTDDLHEAVFPHVHQFVLHSERELQKLEELATVIEETADRLETTTVPLARCQVEQVIEASQLLANEASLRFERLQRMWLQSCST